MNFSQRNGSRWSPAPAPASARRPRERLPHKAFMWLRGAPEPTGSSALAAEIGGTAIVADVTDDDAVAALADALDRVDVLVNNAGGARGLEPVAEADLEHWRWMWETNVLGTLRVTRALLPKLIDSGDGLIVTVTSIAAIETYDNGVGLHLGQARPGCAAPHAARRTAGKTGAAHRDCARDGQDRVLAASASTATRHRADAVYKGVTPLVAEDVAEVIGFVASRPSHVNLDQIVIRPRDQASASRFNRRLDRITPLDRRVGVRRQAGAHPTGVTGAVLGISAAAEPVRRQRRHRHPARPSRRPSPRCRRRRRTARSSVPVTSTGSP